MNGHLATRPFGVLLTDLRTGAKSGILTLSRKEIRKQICLVRGVLRYAASNIRAEGLGPFLVRRGMLSDQDLAWLEARLQPGAARLSPLIIEAGLLPLEPLREAVREHMIQILFPCLEWKDGQFQFSEGVPNIAGEVSVEVLPLELVLERGRRREDPALQSRLRLSRKTPLRRSKLAEQDGRRLRLSEAEGRILDAAASQETLEAAVGRTSTEEDGLLALMALIEAGLVELGAAADARPTPGADPGEARLSQSQERTLAHYKDILIKSEGADHYQILNVPTTATDEDVRRAYYSLARDLHPDRFAAPPLDMLRGEMEVLFARITEAYNILSDVRDRADYDARRAPAAPPTGPDAPPPEPALPQNPRDLARLNYHRGKTLVGEQKFVESLKFLENAASLDPTRPEYLLLLGLVQARNPRGRLEAIATLTAAARLDPTNVKVRLEIARLSRREGDEQTAERWLREALQIEPENAEIREELGEKAGGGLLRGLFGRGEKR